MTGVRTTDETFNFAPYTYLQTPNERGSLWLLGNQPLSGGLELFFEGLFSHRESSQNLAPAPFETESGVPANNYYNPFGVDVPFGVRRLIELDTRSFSQRVEMWRALAGVRGEIGQWTWEVSAATSESDAVTRENGLPLAEPLMTGLGPSGRDASGRIVCGTPDPATGIVPASAVIGGCVPINLFGGAGSITQEQVDYMAGPLRDEGYNKQRLANIGFEGAWGRTPAGEILWALGGEFRRDSGAYRYDPQRVGGTVSIGLAADIPGGSFEAREGYAEVRLPLLDEPSGWGKLGATLGGRVSDFSTFGTHTTWHAGLRWDLSHAWAVRADYATLFRAPALNELYQAQVSGQRVSVHGPLRKLADAGTTGELRRQRRSWRQLCPVTGRYLPPVRRRQYRSGTRRRLLVRCGRGVSIDGRDSVAGERRCFSDAARPLRRGPG